MFLFRGVVSKPSSQRMYLSANVSPASTTTQITGWTADSGYGATTIVSSALVLDRAGTINITSQAVISQNTFNQALTVYLYKNGTSGTLLASASTSGTGTLNLSKTGATVAAGDTLAMYANGGTYAAYIVIASGTSNTYIQFVSQ